jgi:hypothetical protein
VAVITAVIAPVAVITAVIAPVAVITAVITAASMIRHIKVVGFLSIRCKVTVTHGDTHNQFCRYM